MKRQLTPTEREQFRPAVDWLMSEAGHSLTEASAWDVVTSPEKTLRFVEGQLGPKVNRQRAFKTVALSETQAGLRRMSDARTIPGTSIQSVRPTRGVPATGPLPERKPGESQEAFRTRLRRQIEDLAKPAGTAGGFSATRVPSDTENLSETARQAAADAANLDRKKALMANEDEVDRYVASREARVVYADTTALDEKAKSLMKARKQSIDPKSADFRENYTKALGELA